MATDETMATDDDTAPTADGGSAGGVGGVSSALIAALLVALLVAGAAYFGTGE